MVWLPFTTLTSLLIRGVSTHEDQMFGDHKFHHHPCGDKMWRSFGFANSASMPTSFLSWSTERRAFKRILSTTLRDCHRVPNVRFLFALAKNSIPLNIDMNMILRETLLSLCLSFQTISRRFLPNHLLFFMRCSNEKGQIVPLCQSQQNICPIQTSDNFRNPTLVGDVLKRNCVIVCSNLSNWFGKQWHACPRLRIPIFYAKSLTQFEKIRAHCLSIDDT